MRSPIKNLAESVVNRCCVSFRREVHATPAIHMWLAYHVGVASAWTTAPICAKGCVTTLTHRSGRAAVLSASTGNVAAEPPTGAFFELFQQLDSAFSAFDLDGDGAITSAEIGDVMKKLGKHPTEEQLKAIVSEFDENNNGRIDFDEFCELMTRDVTRGGDSDAVVGGIQAAASELAVEDAKQ